MSQITGLEFKLQEMAGRIRTLREIAEFTPAQMAEKTGISVETYIRCEQGKEDLNFAFLYRCALALGVDVTDIIEGASPKLSTYMVTRKGEGQHIEQAHGLTYYNLAARFKNRIANPLYVRAEYSEAAQYSDIQLTTHYGQECDIVIEGRLKVQVGEHIEILEEGDSIYYDSSTPHGMIAMDGKDCLFYAIVLSPDGETQSEPAQYLDAPVAQAENQSRIYENFIIPQEQDGALQAIDFKNEDSFNFAYDIVDVLAETKPDKLAMLHLDANKTERRFTFSDISKNSSRAANYFKSLGIKKGDRVMLVLKRHYQFWFALLGLHKLGAIAIPATNQLQQKDFSYRFAAAGVSAILCTADGNTAEQVDMAAAECGDLIRHKILIGGKREGWHDFDEEYQMYSSRFERPQGDDCPQGEDTMLMFFTSGTTGYPKIAAHSFKYPLGHFITAKYWHCVNPEGLHLTISDTGWAKALWGKLYGQWLCEAAVFVYDFDRFDAHEILPMFAKYHITTFCAPPTMYRFMIKEDLTKYDLSSIEHATIAGEALNPEVFHQFKKATGLSLMEGFGQSETTIVVGNLVGMKPKIGSMGKPVPLYDVDLITREGDSAEIGEVGEIVIKTADKTPCGLFCGYYHEEEKTRESWHDGYYHTGDTAWRDEDGYFWYVGRVDDVIKSSGYRIGPFEIESVIMELPYVLECGVSPAPDPIRGQVVKASIVLTRDTQPSESLKKEIQDYVKKRTAPYKYPRIVVFKDELPKTTSGKIIRNRL